MRLLAFLIFVTAGPAYAQEYRWQQRVEYKMNVHLDVNTHRLKGQQELIYHNASNDTLTTVYYHLFFNAFQPGSMMDMRSRTIADPDQRVGNRIAALKEDEIGFQKVHSLLQDGQPATYRETGTLLEVSLPRPLLPQSSTVLNMDFEAQVPVQIRRSGRNNSEGIAYSMTQWYPKLAEYDYQGWHVYPYVAREFHSVWGNFDVHITLDPSFVVAGTGVLQNAEEIGYGYEKSGTKVKRKKGDLTWHFKASNVHDFAWAADPDYTHIKTSVPEGPELHFFYQKNERTRHWAELPGIAVELFQIMKEKVGAYPYETYSVIQGGDGGMEYPMCTLIMGEGTLRGTSGTMIHEVVHSWFQMVLANNEAQYAWMDEGFTRFAEYSAKAIIYPLKDPFAGTYKAYTAMALSGNEEPAVQFSDFFTLNDAYKIASYIKGCLLLNQLEYIMGEENFRRGMRSYYQSWKFRHPEPIDFIRVMEKNSGLQLKWFLNLWISTVKKIDYGISEVAEDESKARVTLERKGEIPMPIDIRVTSNNGTVQWFHIPVNETLGTKPLDPAWEKLAVWNWVNPTYTFHAPFPKAEVAKIEIDPHRQMADVNPKNNTIEVTDRP